MTMKSARTMVIGTGTMGPSLALTLALYGHRTVLIGRRDAALKTAEQAVRRGHDELAEADLLPADASGWRDRLTFGTDLADAAGGIDFAFDAIAEDLDAKQALFAALEDAAPETAILASTTSGLPVDGIAARCIRPERVAVAHFANPPHLMPAVEVVPGSKTAPAVIETLCDLVRSLDKEPIRLARDLPGHLFNRLQFALMREAFALVRDGVASPEEIDKVVKLGYALRLAAEGPVEKADLAGLPLVASVARYLFPSLDASQAPETLDSLIRDGRTGATAGHGFYDWTPERADAVITARNQEVMRHLKRLRHERDAAAPKAESSRPKKG